MKRREKLKPARSIALLLSGMAPLLMCACQSTSTGNSNRPTHQLAVKSRIKQNQDKYSRLSSSQKAAVNKGSVSKGMSKQAVRLAWGKADKVAQNGKKEQWIYYRREEVVIDYQSPYYTIDRFYHHYRSNRPDGYHQNNLKTVQRISRTVLFENGRVVSWTRERY